MKSTRFSLSVAGAALMLLTQLPAHAETAVTPTTVLGTAPSSAAPAVVVNTNITEAEVLGSAFILPPDTLSRLAGGELARGARGDAH